MLLEPPAASFHFTEKPHHSNLISNVMHTELSALSLHSPGAVEQPAIVDVHGADAPAAVVTPAVLSDHAEAPVEPESVPVEVHGGDASAQVVASVVQPDDAVAPVKPEPVPVEVQGIDAPAEVVASGLQSDDAAAPVEPGPVEVQGADASAAVDAPAPHCDDELKQSGELASATGQHGTACLTDTRPCNFI